MLMLTTFGLRGRFSNGVGCFGDPLKLRLALEVEENCSLLNLATLKDSPNDLVAVKWLFGLD